MRLRGINWERRKKKKKMERKNWGKKKKRRHVDKNKILGEKKSHQFFPEYTKRPNPHVKITRHNDVAWSFFPQNKIWEFFPSFFLSFFPFSINQLNYHFDFERFFNVLKYIRFVFVLELEL